MISIDASVIVKWFKKGEEKEDLALKLKDIILSRELIPAINEYVFLEIIRAVTKAGFPKGKIEKIKKFLLDLEALGYIKMVKVHEVKELAMNLIYSLDLYASDALVLATAIKEKVHLVTEDIHLLKENVRKYAKKNGVEVTTLDRLSLLENY